MPQTTSPTLIRDFIMPIDQTSSTDQNLKAEGRGSDYAAQRRFSHLIKVLGILRESTSDGEVRLRKSLPTPNWVCRRSGGYIIVLLPQAPSSEELLTKTSNNRFFRKQPPQPLPHLEAISWIKEATDLSQERIGRLVGVSRQTIINWENGYPITDTHQQRLFAVRDVLERAARRYQGQAELKAWLDTPSGSDGRTPAQMLEANEINRARLLAVSSPSSSLVPPPVWVKRAVPEKFLAGGERRQEALPPEADSELSALIENGEYGVDENGEVFPLS